MVVIMHKNPIDGCLYFNASLRPDVIKIPCTLGFPGKAAESLSMLCLRSPVRKAHRFLLGDFLCADDASPFCSSAIVYPLFSKSAEPGWETRSFPQSQAILGLERED